MAQIGWSEDQPADTESLALGDDRIRSLKTSLRQGLDTEHVWPSGGGDAGVHRLGSARAYVGPQSAVSSSGTDGRIMWATDSGRLFHVGSDGTGLIGGPAALLMSTFPGAAPQRHYWTEEVGVSDTGSGRTITITYPNSGFSGVPYTFIQQTNVGVAEIGYGTPVVMANSPTGFVGGFFIFSNLSWADNQPFTWRSIGTRVL